MQNCLLNTGACLIRLTGLGLRFCVCVCVCMCVCVLGLGLFHFGQVNSSGRSYGFMLVSKESEILISTQILIPIEYSWGSDHILKASGLLKVWAKTKKGNTKLLKEGSSLTELTKDQVRLYVLLSKEQWFRIRRHIHRPNLINCSHIVE